VLCHDLDRPLLRGPDRIGAAMGSEVLSRGVAATAATCGRQTYASPADVRSVAPSEMSCRSHSGPTPPHAQSCSFREWGLHLESTARRPRALIDGQFLSRYSRFDDGHPSRSPNREWMHLGTKETSLTIKPILTGTTSAASWVPARRTTTKTSTTPGGQVLPGGRFARRPPKSFHRHPRRAAIRPTLPQKPRNYKRSQ
jgi:hypothetical protein